MAFTSHNPHSPFLLDQGYHLTFRTTKETQPLLFEYHLPSFAHVIFFAPESKSKPRSIYLSNTSISSRLHLQHILKISLRSL